MSDRYFDELASHFAKKIYGGTKGAIRLAVLQADLRSILPNTPIRILDIGAGLGHISLWLAEQGHHVTVTEPSAVMLEGAREQFKQAGLNATFIEQPWQQLDFAEPFDLVICHAVLEWLADPLSILNTLKQLTHKKGWLSLAFYNKDALIYRNLLKRNFRKIKKQHFAGEKQSLTPQHPIDPTLLNEAMSTDWHIAKKSGIRVFSDYMPIQFKKMADLESLIEMELEYRNHPTFSGLGCYLHWLCQIKE
ncbi:methyltransferase domain-containing protein [Entomomonas asaccharolytica]|uniref:tRNA 5-carboxymethoxyuridine methyltransferase n=1 Tax=Entomomonas asaccharolytica TaxID=2785331 RepID=A0A974NEU3_9GAMM|nr:methyltransferase domain-containing protein [Entomomonas asaccharolytica]QQP85209.1 methyltransferase domain-containing protein [Entomomonas asaccharolytica]